MALREQAASAADAGNHQRAIGLLERALRISPQDPETFIALARNNMAMDQMQQAIQLARRGLSLNPTDAQRQTLQRIEQQAQAAQ
jgi:Flp pilus assembly protein TadD